MLAHACQTGPHCVDTAGARRPAGSSGRRPPRERKALFTRFSLPSYTLLPVPAQLKGSPTGLEAADEGKHMCRMSPAFLSHDIP